MNGSSTPQINHNTSHSNFSSASQIRLSHLKPPNIETTTKIPHYLQQTRVSLYVPKPDNELPDYNTSPFVLNEDQRNIRSLNHISGTQLEASYQSLGRVSVLTRKDTGNYGPRSSDKPTLSSSQKDRGSLTVGIDVFAEQEKARRERRHAKIEKFLNWRSVSIYLVFCTIYALFGQDFGALITSSPVDTVFDTLTLIATVSFLVEMILGLICRVEYRWSFFFWLDLISTLSMLLDLSFIPSDAIGAQADATQIARAGRVSRIGVRAGRVVKMIRLVRIAKFFKQVKESDKIIRSNSSHSIQSLTNLVDNLAKLKRQVISSTKNRQDDELQTPKSVAVKTPKDFLDPKDLLEEEKAPLAHAPRRLSQFATLGAKSPTEPRMTGAQLRVAQTKLLVASLTEVNAKQVIKENSGAAENPTIAPRESRVGKTLSELTTKRVILIVLILLLVVPLMTSDSWNSDTISYVYDINMIKQAYMNGTLPPSDIDNLIINSIQRHDQTNTPIIYFRAPNGTVVWEVDPIYTEIRFTETDIVDVPEVPNLLLVADITLSIKLTAATNIGRSIFICIILGFGALLFSKDANDLVLRPLERMVEKVNRIAVCPLSVKRESLMDESKKKNETTVLENAITKIGTLLALGFGDAGAQIIAQNMTQTGDMNPLISGEKIMAIFGFCDIRNFTDATEVLQEDVMVFVNSIADIVHDKVDKYGGSANKNIGDAFLLVWKFPKSEVEEMDDELQLKNTDFVKGLADLSLFSFLKIFVKINQSPVLRKYRSNEKLLERLPNYRVKMGFGLHVGWAIEGAIGSEFKIDASYLSPNVNIASRLEAATKQYGVPLLVSNDLYVLFSEEVQKICRKIDVVTVKGSQVPLALYTIDIDASQLRDKGGSKRVKSEKIRRHEMKKQKLMELIWEGKLSTHLLFEKDKDLKIAMKKGYDAEPRKAWDEGLDAYIEGDWQKARLMFDTCMVLKEADGPASTLLAYMSSHGYKKPSDWRGFRELTDK